jgi:hypothetical protein
MKNVLFEQEKIKVQNKWHFVKNKTEIMQHVLKMQYIFLLPKYIKLILGVFFSLAFTYTNAGLLMVNTWDLAYD